MTLENAWKAAARHWWERMRWSDAHREALVEAASITVAKKAELQRELDGTRLAYAICCAERDTLKARQEAREIEERRETQARFEHGTWTLEGKPGGDSTAYDRRQEKLAASEARADMWQGVATQLDARLAEARDELADRESVIGFEALAARIAEADRKHPRDLKDTHLSATDAENCLYEVRRELKQHSTWAAALECEMWEAISAAISESDERLADELLDVAALSLRWRRAILERGK